MKNNHSRLKLGLVVLLLAGAACVLPGQATQPAPVTNPIAIETAVAGTVQAAAQTDTAQSVATEAPAGMTGTTIEQGQDGITKYTDYDAGFEISFPIGWLTVRPNSEEFNAALAKEGAVNPILLDQMTFDQSGYKEVDRLYSYILRPDIQKNVMFGFSKLAWDSEDTVSLNNVTMGKLVDELEASGDIPGFHATTAQVYEGGAITMIEVGGRWMLNDEQGGAIPFYSTFIVFKPAPNSLVRITFTFLDEHRLTLSVDVRFIMESIRIISP